MSSETKAEGLSGRNGARRHVPPGRPGADTVAPSPAPVLEVPLVDLLAQAVLDGLEEEEQIDRALDLVVDRVLAWQEQERSVEAAGARTVVAAQEQVAEPVADAGPTGAAAPPPREPIRLSFRHGLGDCAQFAHVLALCRRQGYEFEVACAPDKEVLFQAAGVRIGRGGAESRDVGWREAGGVPSGAAAEYWRYNKAAVNLNRDPLPDLGDLPGLWPQLCDTRLDVRPFLRDEDWREVRRFTRPLPRPLVLVHTKGNTWQERKNLPDDLTVEVCRCLLDGTDGSLLLLDWDDRVPRIANWRVRHLTDDWMPLDTRKLLALMFEADLLLGVDSGPLHAARLAGLPTVGVFPVREHYPTRFCLPRPEQALVVPRDAEGEWSRQVRIAYNIVEAAGAQVDAVTVAQTCLRVLAGPRYLDAARAGADVQLQQFVLDWERGRPNALTAFPDRHRGFDVLLREVGRRFESPTVVETGCIRAPEDWGGAGYGTYLLAAFLERHGGELVSVDIAPAHCAFARLATREMSCVTVEEGDSVPFLRGLGRPVHVLVLDSMDTELDGHEAHCLREIRAALPLLAERALVVFDDTVFRAGRFHGKGGLAVPWLLSQGWYILHSGHQTICARAD